VVDQPVGNLSRSRLIQQPLDQRDFGRAGGVYVDCERQAVSIDEEHELAAFAAFGGTNAITPFFAAANVPSAKPSFQLISPCSSLSCGHGELTSGSILDPALTRDRTVISGLLSPLLRDSQKKRSASNKRF